MQFLVLVMNAGKLDWMKLWPAKNSERHRADRRSYRTRAYCTEIPVSCRAANLCRVSPTHAALTWAHGGCAVTFKSFNFIETLLDSLAKVWFRNVFTQAHKAFAAFLNVG